jgi:hypothetical protein
MARVTGLEPATSGVTGRRSNQLSYTRLRLEPFSVVVRALILMFLPLATPISQKNHGSRFRDLALMEQGSVAGFM